MFPECITTPNPQSFAIPYQTEKLTMAHPNMGKYVQNIAKLANAAKHLWGVAYGGKGFIVSSAIVEEVLDNSTVWWLIFTHITPTKEYKVKSWLYKHLPPDTGLDVEGLQTLSPWLQRRFGWGDIRTTPKLIEGLQQEARLPMFSSKDKLVAHRHELAREELRIRQPEKRPTQLPILNTQWGHKARLAQELGDDELLQQITSVADIIPMHDKTPAVLENGSGTPLALGNGGLANNSSPSEVKSAEFDIMWGPHSADGGINGQPQSAHNMSIDASSCVPTLP